MKIEYARGRNIRDAHPDRRIASNFEAFYLEVLADQGEVKGKQWISAPFGNDGRRCARNAGPRAFLPLDFDKISPGSLNELWMWLGQFRGFGYSTASSTDAAPRERAIIALSREVTPEESQRIGAAVLDELRTVFGDKVVADPCVFRHEQPIYTPLKGARSRKYDGHVLNVDEVLIKVQPVARSTTLFQDTVQPVTHEANPIPEGARHKELMTRAASMRAKGASNKAIVAALEADNMELCRPPLGSEELESIARWVCGKPPGFGMDSRRPSALATPVTKVHPEVLSGTDLIAMDNSPPLQCVSGRIPSGLVVVAGRPKCRKSWLALQIALATARGSETLEGATTQGEVLALLLEDNRHRLGVRLDFFGVTDITMPQGLHVAFSWPTGADGAAEIARWIQEHPSTRLVVVDVLARFRGPRDARTPAYDQDYAAMTLLHKLTVDFPGLTILVIHHIRKGETTDPVEAISGTYGIAGAADAMVIFARAQDKGLYHVHITGRDWQSFESDFLWEFSRGIGWRWLGVLDQNLTDRQDEILALARQGEITPSVLAKQFGISRQAAGQSLKALESKGKLLTSHGRYRLARDTRGIDVPDGLDVPSSHRVPVLDELDACPATGP